MVGWWVEPDRKEKRGNASKGRKARVGMMLAWTFQLLEYQI